MKVLMINSVCGTGSTGRICTDLADCLMTNGNECRIAYGRGISPQKYLPYSYRIGRDFDIKIHGIMTRLSDKHGFYSKKATKKLVEWIKCYNPDVIHLHNLHGYYINIEILFEYLKTCGKKIFWTLHDCWAFTGHCAHYSAKKCYQWKTACKVCNCLRDYPKCYLKGNVYFNYMTKQNLFCGINNLKIITPSNWLCEQVKMSFLKNYKTVVIPNGIDLNTFSHTNEDFFREYHRKNIKILLGVASVWSKNKGIEDFNQLANFLDKSYKVVLVGIDEDSKINIDNKILCLPHCEKTEILAKIYSSADLFINPSVEETMGMTTLEAIACGTPAIVYNCTALPEVIDSLSGIVVEPGVENILNALDMALKIDKTDCIKRAGLFSLEHQYNKYIDMYYGKN